ncbi:MAG: stage 0 sporulation protein [Ruminococcaceae bacterium]|nr:stage 0 sporulation protein [Oscillospiraceae bacterium]
MTEVIGIKFKKGGKIYYFGPAGINFKKGSFAIVETSRGVEIGEVALENREVPDDCIVPPLKNVLREATPADIKKSQEAVEREKQAFEICQKKILEHKLDMNLINVECSFDSNRLLFYFTSEGRVDFRELVKDLASIFKTRIELRQIGVRDEAKLQGGLGICGRPFCCSSFLGDFHPVSIKMAKEQGLSLNPTKISGTCDRLMCCLKYEQNAYEDLAKTTPRVGSIVQTPDGNGVVTEIYLLKGLVKVRLDSNPDATPKIYNKEDLKILKKKEEPETQETEIVTDDSI